MRPKKGEEPTHKEKKSPLVARSSDVKNFETRNNMKDSRSESIVDFSKFVSICVCTLGTEQ